MEEQRKSMAGIRRWYRAVPVLALAVSMFVSIGRSETAVGSVVGYGKVHGIVTDIRSGESLIGVTVVVDGTRLGAATDLDGKFVVRNVPYGTYSLSISSIGYAKIQVTEVLVGDAPGGDLQVQLTPQVYEQKAVRVTAKRLMNNESSLLKHRQAAIAVSDAISSEAIAKAGSGDAAQAMTHVTGASVVNGKYVFIRGLGDRYSNTLINGSLAPSADPDKQAVNMDMVPAGLLDNIVVEKTFTPDKPGNFSGGSVNLNTKDSPDGRLLTFSTSGSYNSQATSSNVLTQQSGAKDWLGMGGGSRELPAMFSDPTFRAPSSSQGRTNDSIAGLIEQTSKAFSGRQMHPGRGKGSPNQSYGLTFGDQWKLFGAQFGVMSSFNYSRNLSFYDDGQVASYIYQLGDPTLTRIYSYKEAQAKDEVLWGGLLNSSLQLALNHKLGLTWVYNQSGESTNKMTQGYERDEAAEPGSTLRTRALEYTERNLSSAQIKGEHAGLPLSARLDWKLTLSDSKQDEPDSRVFADVQTVEGADTTYNVGHTQPSRYFRILNEDNREGRVDITLPFKQWSQLPSKFKFGGYFLHKTRDFRERHFIISSYGVGQYNGDPDEFLAPENVGWLNPDTLSSTTNRFGPTWTVATAYSVRHNYDAKQDIGAGYGMLEFPLTTRLNVVGGARYETTEMWLDQVLDSTDDNRRSLITQYDWLPSVNLIYKMRDDMNLRAAYGKTLARPTLRELALFSSLDLSTGHWEIGNPNLEMSGIDNYDLRWEWFVRPGEILALSLFGKRLKNPIEQVIIDDKNNIQYQNVDKATVYGIELEGRLDLGHIRQFLRNLSIGGNLSLIESRIDLSDQEIAVQRVSDPNASDHREMWGQSPYVINLDLGYANQKRGTAVNFMINRFGRRLAAVSRAELPDIYEMPRTTVDVTFSQRLLKIVKFKVSGKNLTDSRNRRSMDFLGQEYIQHEYGTGRTFGAGISVDL